MPSEIESIPGVTDDPVMQLLLSGRAKTLDEAEELYLDSSLDVIVSLISRSQDDDELMRHPLMRLLYDRRTRGREDSLL